MTTPASARSAVIAATSPIPSVVRCAPTTLGSSANATVGAANTHGAIGTTTLRNRALVTVGIDSANARRRATGIVSGTPRSAVTTTIINAM